jgi:serine/threonine protein kinase
MGTQIYMAPEIHNAKDIPCRAQVTDIFSLGVLFFMLAFGGPPFESTEMSDGFFCFLKSRPESLDFFKYHPHTRMLFRDNKIPESFMKLLLAMLRAEPTLRVSSVEQLMTYEFFSEVDYHQEVTDGP